jgi:hypothetical protein
MPGGGVGRPFRQTTTICPLTSPEERELANGWVRSAIEESKCLFVESDVEFPKKIWYEAEGRFWMGLCINRASGDYKGWPVEKEHIDAVFGRLARGIR